MDEHDSFPQRVWQIVASVPEGYVTTYGDVARLAGSPRAARQVGGVLKRLPEGSTLPWHRVVNRHGVISLTTSGITLRRCAGVGVRADRFTEVSLGILTPLPKERGNAEITSASVGLAGKADWSAEQPGLRSAAPAPGSGQLWSHRC